MSEYTLYDMIIVGAGPAGSTLARLASSLSGLRVLLLDARNLDCPYVGQRQIGHEQIRQGRIKSCGGLLAPDAQRALARLHGALPAEVLASPQLFAVRTIDLPTGREALYQRCYVNIRREAFDRWLYAQADQAARISGILVQGIAPCGDGWELRSADGRRFRGRFLVGADGANSVVRRLLFPALGVRRYASIQEAFPADAAAPQFAALFDPEITDYYAWGLPKDDEYLVGAALPLGPGANNRFRLLKERLKAFGFRLDRPLRREATLLTRPCPLPDAPVRVGSPGAPCACLIGEAGGFVSPSSAEGISYALNTAMALHEALHTMLNPEAGGFLSGLTASRGPGLSGLSSDRSLADSTLAPAFFPTVCRRYARLLWPLRLKLLAKYGKSQVLYRPSLRHLVMASGLTAISPLGGRKR